MRIKSIVQTITPYIRISRPLTQLSQIQILVGFLYGSGGVFTKSEIITVLEVMVVLFITYTGIYSFNDVIDVELDKQHSQKKLGRMIAADRISKQSGIMYAAFCIFAGLSMGVTISNKIFLVQAVLLSINFLYTLWFKHYKYIDIFLNSVTHPLRTFLGVILTNLSLINFLPLFFIHLFLAISATSIRRYRELLTNNIKARPVLKKYSKLELKNISHLFFFIALGGIALFWNLIPFYIKFLALLYPICTVFLYDRSLIIKQTMKYWYYGYNAGAKKSF